MEGRNGGWKPGTGLGLIARRPMLRLWKEVPNWFTNCIGREPRVTCRFRHIRREGAEKRVASCQRGIRPARRARGSHGPGMGRFFWGRNLARPVTTSFPRRRESRARDCPYRTSSHFSSRPDCFIECIAFAPHEAVSLSPRKGQSHTSPGRRPGLESKHREQP